MFVRFNLGVKLINALKNGQYSTQFVKKRTGLRHPKVTKASLMIEEKQTYSTTIALSSKIVTIGSVLAIISTVLYLFPRSSLVLGLNKTLIGVLCPGAIGSLDQLSSGMVQSQPPDTNSNFNGASPTFVRV